MHQTETPEVISFIPTDATYLINQLGCSHIQTLVPICVIMVKLENWLSINSCCRGHYQNGYSCTRRNIHTAHKRGQIPVPKRPLYVKEPIRFVWIYWLMSITVFCRPTHVCQNEAGKSFLILERHLKYPLNFNKVEGKEPKWLHFSSYSIEYTST